MPLPVGEKILGGERKKKKFREKGGGKKGGGALEVDSRPSVRFLVADEGEGRN